MFDRLHHIQLAMPAGAEDRARTFDAGAPGLREIEKRPVLAARGGAWFAAGVDTRPDDGFAGHRRVYADDPFGNRLELLHPE